ncbi:hypothetical protein KZ810_07140 [Sphingomonas sp. RHCKR47]|uniref:hypothetical protein n=1 Tax=Sphingomonas citricola TaxID=2862498 RepID=UPI001CA59B0A|nr:hypothetical protein [Sphingomonas citricola]MBW6523272.1 hypothetical protein [Sphingomonas citricola]
MKKDTLPTHWVRWRRRRYQSLSAQGLASHLAWEVAKGEAKGRHQISAVIGEQAARDADLIVVGQGENLRFALTGGIAGLAAEQVAGSSA